MPYLGSSPARGLVGTADIDANAVDGTLTKDALIADYSDVTITASDLIMYGDATDSNNTKRDTVQGILDLAGGGAFEKIFIAENSGNQTISTNTWTTATFDTEILDQGSHFASNKFTAPSTGKYMFFVTFPYMDSPGTVRQDLAILHYNSSDVLQFQRGVAKTNFHEAAMSGGAAFSMSANDYALMQVRHEKGSNVVLYKAQFFGWRVV